MPHHTGSLLAATEFHVRARVKQPGTYCHRDIPTIELAVGGSERRKSNESSARKGERWY